MHMCTLVSVLGLALVADLPRIVAIAGGENAEDGKYTYMVSIHVDGSHLCGGAIVGTYYILTAAHCLKESVDKIKILVGTNSQTEGGEKYDVENKTIHPSYRPGRPGKVGYHDIAVAKTSKEITYGDKVGQINLNSDDFSGTAVITGWGAFPDNSLPTQLQELQVQTGDDETCRDRASFIKDSQMCTLAERNRGACFKDSGGPLVGAQPSGKVVVGVYTIGNDACGKATANIYSRVAYYIDWIRLAIK